MKFAAKIAVALAAVAMLATPALASPPAQLAKMVEEMSGGTFIIKADGKEKHKARQWSIISDYNYIKTSMQVEE